MEAFAQIPATHIAWSNEVGGLGTTDARTAETAQFLEDTAQPPDRMRGIRIALCNQNSEDRIYLGEESLAAYKEVLDEFSRFPMGTKRLDNRGGINYLGTPLFWNGDKIPRVHALNRSFPTLPQPEIGLLGAWTSHDPPTSR